MSIYKAKALSKSVSQAIGIVVLVSVSSAAFAETPKVQPQLQSKTKPKHAKVQAKKAAKQAPAVNLLEAYRQAKLKDPTLKSAEATYKAQKELTPIAWSALLPQITGTANTTGNRQSPGLPENYNSHGFGATLTQSVFSYSNWKTVAASYPQVAQAASDYETAKQSLILRVAQAYLGVLQAEDELKAAQANEEALAETLKQTEQRFNVGLVAVTDVQTTKASYESAIAERVQAENAVANQQEALAEITGKVEKNLVPMRDDIPLTRPNPDKIDAWVEAALKGNPSLASARYNAAAADDNVGVAMGKFIPTVDGTLSYARSGSNSSQPPSSSLSRSAQLSATWNIYNGGGDYAGYKQSQYTADAAQSDYVKSLRGTTTQTRQDYLSVIAGIGTVEAYKQAVISSESSLKSFQAGYAVGTETIVNVLDAQKKLFDSQSSYAQQKYKYIVDTLSLQADTGALTLKNLEKVNSWLKKS